MKWIEKDTYHGKQRHYEINKNGINITVHRRETDPSKWFLSAKYSPLDCYPLVEFHIEDAKNEALNLMVEYADNVQNDLHQMLKNDSKKVQSFKLRLIAILNEAEKLEDSYNPFDKDNNIYFEGLIDTIKTAMSDLD